jgi:hypothetical protein
MANDKKPAIDRAARKAAVLKRASDAKAAKLVKPRPTKKADRDADRKARYAAVGVNLDNRS